MKSGYNSRVVTAFFASQGIPAPDFEYQFHETRRWRFDLAFLFPCSQVAIEVQGGLFIRGGHNRGAQIAKEHEKYNEAAALGWRILYCQPSELCSVRFADTIKRALALEL